MRIYQLGIAAEDVLKRRQRKILKNPAHLRLRAFEIDVRLKLALAAHEQPRMTRVDLARMDVEHHGPAFVKNLVSHPANQPVREQPQISATEETHRLTHQVR